MFKRAPNISESILEFQSVLHIILNHPFKLDDDIAGRLSMMVNLKIVRMLKTVLIFAIGSTRAVLSKAGLYRQTLLTIYYHFERQGPPLRQRNVHMKLLKNSKCCMQFCPKLESNELLSYVYIARKYSLVLKWTCYFTIVESKARAALGSDSTIKGAPDLLLLLLLFDSFGSLECHY